jgi:hypothetical protein
MSNQGDEPMNGTGSILPWLLDVGQAAKYLSPSVHIMYTDGQPAAHSICEDRQVD